MRDRPSMVAQQRFSRPSHSGIMPRGVKGAIGLLGILTPCLIATAATALDPEGEWWVADRAARIRVVNCAGAMWGIVSWEANPGLDSNNPDPAKRRRPILGMPVLLGMKEAKPSRWAGPIYNSSDGKTYSGGFTVPSANSLRVTGCVLRVLCGSQTWSRAAAGARSETLGPSAAICSRLSETR